MRHLTQEQLQKSATYRVLMVMEEIGLSGPIRLAQLEKKLPISDAAIWRAAAMLRDFGWVRMRLADNALELTSNVSNWLEHVTFAPQYSDQVVKEINDHLEKGAESVDAGMFTEMGQFYLIDSSRKDANLDEPLSLVEDTFALEVQRRLPTAEVAQHLNAYIQFAPPHEVRLIEDGDHAHSLKKGIHSKRNNSTPGTNVRPKTFGNSIVYFKIVAKEK